MGESPAEFFSRNSRLFTVLGVFGAISVYFTQLDVQSRWQRLGVVSSLTIFLLVAIAIQREVPPDSSDKLPLDFVIKHPWRRKSQVVFYVSFYAVVISVFAIVIQFSNTLIFLVQFLCAVLGIGAATWLVGLADPDDVTIEIGTDPRAIPYLSYPLRNAIYALVVGGGGLLLLWVAGRVPVSQLVKFQITSPVLAIAIGFSGGFGIGGALFCFTFSLAILMHLWLHRLWLDDSLEEFGEFYQQSFLSGWDEE